MGRKFPAALTADIIAEEGFDENAASLDDAAVTPQWVNRISYWQDYMTIIELEETPAPGLRPAS